MRIAAALPAWHACRGRLRDLRELRVGIAAAHGFASMCELYRCHGGFPFYGDALVVTLFLFCAFVTWRCANQNETSKSLKAMLTAVAAAIPLSEFGACHAGGLDPYIANHVFAVKLSLILASILTVESIRGGRGQRVLARAITHTRSRR